MSDSDRVQDADVLFLCTGNYFRSRFAELLFNQRAAARGLGLRAVSAGLAPDCRGRNQGPISSHTLAGLTARGINAEAPRPPRDAQASDFERARIIVALQESEHRPFIEQRFAAFSPRVRYWAVRDIPDVDPLLALAEIERQVERLLDELGRAG